MQNPQAVPDYLIQSDAVRERFARLKTRDVILDVRHVGKRFATPQGFNTGDHFFDYLRDAFDVLYAEGDEAPKMLSIGMHCRLLGRPGRFRGLQRFLDHIEKHDRVWVTRRVDIARHWREHHPYQPNHQNEGKA